MKHNSTNSRHTNTKTFKNRAHDLKHRSYEIPAGKRFSKAQKWIGSLIAAGLVTVGVGVDEGIRWAAREYHKTSVELAQNPYDQTGIALDSVKAGGTVKYDPGMYSVVTNNNGILNSDRLGYTAENPLIVGDGKGNFYFVVTPMEKDGISSLKSDTGANLVADGIMQIVPGSLNMTQSEYNALPNAQMDKNGNLVSTTNPKVVVGKTTTYGTVQ